MGNTSEQGPGSYAGEPQRPARADRPARFAEPPAFDPTVLSGPLSRSGELELTDPLPGLARPGRETDDAGSALPAGSSGQLMASQPVRDVVAYEEVVPQEAREHLDAVGAAAPRPAPHLPEAPTGTTETITSIMGSVKRQGGWVPAEHITANVLMGDVKLDFTSATSLPPQVTVRAQILMGDCTILVPPHAQVSLQGTPIMGDIKEVTKHRWRKWGKSKRGRLPHPEGTEPVTGTAGDPLQIVVTGVVVMGDVKVQRIVRD